MTPKEKAIELAMKFDKHGETDNAKSCALICADEATNWDYHLYMSEIQANNYCKFWNEVKLEIEKL